MVVLVSLFQLVYQQENSALDAIEEESTVASLTQENVPENTESTDKISELYSGVSWSIEGSVQDHQTSPLEEQGALSQKISGKENENGDEVNEEIEMSTVKVRI